MAKKATDQTDEQQQKAEGSSNAPTSTPSVQEDEAVDVEVIHGQVWHSGQKYVIGDKVCMAPNDAKRLVEGGFVKEV